MNQTELKGRVEALVAIGNERAFTDAERQELASLTLRMKDMQAASEANAITRAMGQALDERILPAVAGNKNKDELRSFRDAFLGFKTRDAAVGGGVMVPTTLNAEIRKLVQGFNGLQGAVKFSVGAGFESYPLFTSLSSGSWAMEGATINGSDAGTGSIDLKPNPYVVKTGLSDRLANASDEDFIADFVATTAEALFAGVEQGLWNGTGTAPQPTGLVVGAGVDGIVASASVDMTSSAALTNISKAIGTARAALNQYANGAVAVVTNALEEKLFGTVNGVNELSGIAQTYLLTKTLFGLPTVKLGTSVTYASGTPILALVNLTQFKARRFNSGNLIYKRLEKDISADHVVLDFLDSKIARKGAVYVIKGA